MIGKIWSRILNSKQQHPKKTLEEKLLRLETFREAYVPRQEVVLLRQRVLQARNIAKENKKLEVVRVLNSMIRELDILLGGEKHDG